MLLASLQVMHTQCSSQQLAIAKQLLSIMLSHSPMFLAVCKKMHTRSSSKQRATAKQWL